MQKTINGMAIGPSTLGVKPKRIFNPKNREDLLEYKYFVTKGTWKNKVCPFKLEWPYISVPHMLHELVAKHYVTKEFK
jgi:hypothetical protein